MFDSIFSDGELSDYIVSNCKDPWRNTPFEGYVHMSPKQKGNFGEVFITKYLQLLGHEVKRAKTSTSGHDRIVNGIRTEFKFSLAKRDKNGNLLKDQFMINHVSKQKDWQRLVFFGINIKEEEAKLLWFDKQDFIDYLETPQCVFRRQQGGESIQNDDYMCVDVNSLEKEKFVNSIKNF